MNTDPTKHSHINTRIGIDTYSSILDEIPPFYFRAPVYLITGFCFILIVFLFVFQTQRVIIADGVFVSQAPSRAIISDYDCNVSDSLVNVGDKIAENSNLFLIEPILGSDNPKILKKKILLLKNTIASIQQGQRILSKINRNSNMIESYQNVAIENSKVNNFISKLLKIHIRLQHFKSSSNNIDQFSIDLLEIEKKQLLSNINSILLELQLELDQSKLILSSYEDNLRLLQSKMYNSYVKSSTAGVVIELLKNKDDIIESGEVVARILPSSTSLTVRAKVRSSHIHLIDLGHSVYIKLKSYPFQKFGIITGTINKISPDLGDAEHFIVDIKPNKSSIQIDDTIINMYPGLLANIEILTKKQAVINFFLKVTNTVGEI